MSNEMLFPGCEGRPLAPAEAPQGPVRVQSADRRQGLLIAAALDSLIPVDHRARTVWAFVRGHDLSKFYEGIRSVEGHAGRPPIDPAILVALWLYATVEGVGSARALARLCEEHAAYRWICGGVSVGYHTLADFRTERAAEVDTLLTESVAVLMAEGLVTLERVAQDGMRVRASAGAASFRSQEVLERCLMEAEEQVRRLREELDTDPQATTRRQAAAKERATREREERVRQALVQREELAKRKKGEEDRKKARISTTDPEARVMKMGDGGFRPAFNAQMATDTQSQVIVGVDVGNVGNDNGQLPPMVAQIEERFGKRPEETLVDGGFAKREDIEEVGRAGTAVYAPVRAPRNPSRDPHAPRRGDSPKVVEWRARMTTPEAKAIYKERAATAECVNALARNRGLVRVTVRGIRKVRAVLLWFAVAHNMMRAVSLRAMSAAA